MEEPYITNYQKTFGNKSFREVTLLAKSLGWNIKEGKTYTLYLCEYCYNGELEINYFLGKDVTYNKDGEILTIFMDLSRNLIGGALKTADGSQYEMKRGSVTYDDIQERVSVDFNCSIWSFIGYDEIAKMLIESGEVVASSPKEMPDEVLKYVRENYSKLIFGKDGVRLLAID